MRRGNRIYPALRRPLEVAAGNDVVIGQHERVAAHVLGDGRQVCFVGSHQRIGCSGNADEAVVAFGNAKAQGVRVNVSVTVRCQDELCFLENGCVVLQHFFLDFFRGHFAAVEVGGMPLAPFAEGTDVDVFDSRVAVVLLCQRCPEVFCRLHIDGVIPNGNGGTVAFAF